MNLKPILQRATPLLAGLFLALMYFNGRAGSAAPMAATATPLPIVSAADAAPQAHFPGIISGAIIILIVILVGVLLQPRNR